MAKKNNFINKINLRGDSNFETLLNTVNALVGISSTTLFVGAGLATNLTEVGLGLTGKAGKKIAATAKEDGFMATWDSLRSEDAVDAANESIYSMKDKIIGKANKAAAKPSRLQKALGKLPKEERTQLKMTIKAARAAKLITGKEIDIYLKDHDLEELVAHMATLTPSA